MSPHPRIQVRLDTQDIAGRVQTALGFESPEVTAAVVEAIREAVASFDVAKEVKKVARQVLEDRVRYAVQNQIGDHEEAILSAIGAAVTKTVTATTEAMIGGLSSKSPRSVQVENAIGFLARPDRERVLRRLRYSDDDIDAYERNAPIGDR